MILSLNWKSKVPGVLCIIRFEASVSLRLCPCCCCFDFPAIRALPPKYPPLPDSPSLTQEVLKNFYVMV